MADPGVSRTMSAWSTVGMSLVYIRYHFGIWTELWSNFTLLHFSYLGVFGLVISLHEVMIKPAVSLLEVDVNRQWAGCG